MDGVKVDMVSSFKLLGVIIDNNLSFSNYAIFICETTHVEFSIENSKSNLHGAISYKSF